VREHLDFFAAAYRLPKRKRRQIIEEVMVLTDLSGLAGRMAETLSKGMRQRLCLAKTLVHEPQVLILDEPAAGLDPRARIELRELLKELRNLGKTILISSHILTELSEFCTAVGVIERGRIRAWGGVQEITEKLLTSSRLVTIRLSGAGENGNGAQPRPRDEGAEAGPPPAEDAARAELTRRAVELLSRDPDVLSAQAHYGDVDGEPALRVVYQGERRKVAEFNRMLVQAGFEVVGLEEQRGNLEEVFMRVTEGEVS
jgi:ABC-2 type transport system ATP-binding protein